MLYYPGLDQHIELLDQYLILLPLHYCEAQLRERELLPFGLILNLPLFLPLFAVGKELRFLTRLY